MFSTHTLKEPLHSLSLSIVPIVSHAFLRCWPLLLRLNPSQLSSSLRVHPSCSLFLLAILLCDLTSSLPSPSCGLPLFPLCTFDPPSLKNPNLRGFRSNFTRRAHFLLRRLHQVLPGVPHLLLLRLGTAPSSSNVKVWTIFYLLLRLSLFSFILQFSIYREKPKDAQYCSSRFPWWAYASPSDFSHVSIFFICFEFSLDYPLQVEN